MARPADGLKVVSANRLDSGAVVWLAADDQWQHHIAGASVFEGATAEAALERAKASAATGVVVDPSLIDVTLENGAPRAVRPRERIRSLGPSVRADLGVQAGRRQ